MDDGKRLVPEVIKCKADERAVFQGTNYRITVLSERLIRLEYNPSGNFSDRLTTKIENLIYLTLK